MKLNNLKVNNTGKIIRVIADDNIKRRLMDIGFVRGTNIKLLFENKSMRAYKIKSAVIAVRKEDTKNIEVEI